ncbi:MAG: hypothetical protein IJT50_04435 [Lentisphaeria bacterium]|nr:hypothetical protein [Lentisphaeria bacterium]
MYELVYTSSPRGLLAGRSGFSTVAMTAGFPPNLISPIENMSGYRNLFPPGHPDADRNPVNYSCQHYRWGGTLFIVLSRISYAGLSFTGRTNVLAHHLLFTPAELAEIPGGATTVLRCPENFPPWTGEPRELPQKSLKRVGRAPAASPELWAELAGDRNWAAYAAECFRTDPKHGLVLAFDPMRFTGENLLELIGAVTDRLSPEEAMNFTFSTFCTSPAVTSSLAVRGCPEGSPLPANAEHLTPESVIHLGRNNPIPGDWQPPAPPEPPEPPEPSPPPQGPEPPTGALRTTEEKGPGQPEEPELSAPARIRPISSGPPRVRAFVPGGEASAPQRPKPGAPIPEELPEKGLSLRGIIFAAAALLLGGLLLALVFVTSPEEKRTPPAPAPSPRNSSPAAPPRTARPPAPPPRNRPRPSAARALPQQVETPAEFLKQRFLFHREFNLRRKAPLPRSFRNSSALAVTLRGIGDAKDLANLASYVSAKGRKVTVRPYKEIDREPRKEKVVDGESLDVMTLELTDDFLIVKVPRRAKNHPRIENIGKITITGPGGKPFDFAPNDPDRDFIGNIRRNPGRMTIARPEAGKYECVYTFSEDLWAFRRHLAVLCNRKSVGDIESKTIPLTVLDFTYTQKLLDRWNTGVKSFRNAESELDKCKKEDKSFGKEFEKLMSEVPPKAGARKKKLAEAVAKGKRSISDEVAALCAELPRYKKDGSDTSGEHPLAEGLRRLGERWKDMVQRKDKEKILERKTAAIKKLQAETEEHLQTLPPQLFGTCLDQVKKNQGVSPGFCTKISDEMLKKAIMIELDWR